MNRCFSAIAIKVSDCAICLQSFYLFIYYLLSRIGCDNEKVNIIWIFTVCVNMPCQFFSVIQPSSCPFFLSLSSYEFNFHVLLTITQVYDSNHLIKSPCWALIVNLELISAQAQNSLVVACKHLIQSIFMSMEQFVSINIFFLNKTSVRYSDQFRKE